MANVVDACASAAYNKNSFLALLEDGTVHHWGTAYTDKDAQPPPPSALTDIIDIDSNQALAYAVRKDGTVVCWKPGGAEIAVPDHIKDVAEIDSGTQFCLALTTKNEVLAWGSAANARTDVPADLGPCTLIRADSQVGAAKKEDGTWVAWGAKTDGMVDKINSLGAVHDIGFFGSETRGFNSFLLWIE